MSENIAQKALRYQKEALNRKKNMEAKKFHKIKLLFWPPYQKEYYICLAVIECINQLLDFRK